jgi:hypothetical protein
MVLKPGQIHVINVTGKYGGEMEMATNKSGIYQMKNLIYIIVFFLSFFVSGCAVVQQFERERLSDPNMIFDNNPLQKGIKEHYIDVREGSEGATGSQGGGCGCG